MDEQFINVQYAALSDTATQLNQLINNAEQIMNDLSAKTKMPYWESAAKDQFQQVMSQWMADMTQLHAFMQQGHAFTAQQAENWPFTDAKVVGQWSA